jgi:hypothetical protein
MSKITRYLYCPSCSYRALVCKIETDPDDKVVSYACRCITCGYGYETGAQEKGGMGTFASSDDISIRFPDQPTVESVESWIRQVEGTGKSISFASAFDQNSHLVFLRGNAPDWAKVKLSDLGYTLKPVRRLQDGDFCPCNRDDPRRIGWGIFELNPDGTIGKRTMFSSDLLAATLALEPAKEDEEE